MLAVRGRRPGEKKGLRSAAHWRTLLSTRGAEMMNALVGVLGATGVGAGFVWFGRWVGGSTREQRDAADAQRNRTFNEVAAGDRGRTFR